jgi:hypothetical protein
MTKSYTRFEQEKEMMIPNTKQAKQYPKSGDPYVHCGHPDYVPFHVWQASMRFARPDGSVGTAKWLTCCEPCFHLAQGDAHRVLVRGDSIWSADKPLVTGCENIWESDPEEARLEAMQCDSSLPMQLGFGVAAERLGTTDLAFLALVRPGPAAAIEAELLKGSFPATQAARNERGSAFVVSTDSAIRLLRAYGQAGGCFVADRVESRAHLHQRWTMTIDAKKVDACSYHDHRPAFFVSSDFPGLDTFAEAVPEDDTGIQANTAAAAC